MNNRFFNTQSLIKNMCLVSLFTFSVLSTGCGKEKSVPDTRVYDEVIGEEMSDNTLTFSKSDENCVTHMLFTYNDNSLESVGITEEYTNRDTASKAYNQYASDNSNYTDTSIDNKCVNYTLTGDALSSYASLDQEAVKTQVVNNGFSLE